MEKLASYPYQHVGYHLVFTAVTSLVHGENVDANFDRAEGAQTGITSKETLKF